MRRIAEKTSTHVVVRRPVRDRMGFLYGKSTGTASFLEISQQQERGFLTREDRKVSDWQHQLGLGALLA